MKIAQTYRKKIFWLLDFLKGGKLKKHYYDVVLKNDDASSHQSVQLKAKALTDLLNHAVATTDFYKGKRDYHDLTDFPIINKSIVRNSFNAFLSCEFTESSLIPVVTSGSTGTPFKIYQDPNKKLRNSADAIYFAENSGYTIGYRLFYLKIFVKEKMKSRFAYWMENTIPIDVLRLTDEEIEKFLNQIESTKSPYAIIGYSSALERVCKYLDHKRYGKLKTDIRSVIAISETLNDYTKASIEEHFGVRSVSRYSNLENGIIAQQNISSNGKYLINTASYVIEILKFDTDEPAEPGQLGRIIVTDLYNYGMPMIRYDTGDVGIISQEREHNGNLYLSKVEGRKLDLLYDTKGNLISSYLVYKNMWKYTEIIQYQLIQEGLKEYTFKINSNEAFNRESNLINEFKEYLGQDAIFTVVYVSEIPLLSSGKRKFIINHYLQSLS